MLSLVSTWMEVRLGWETFLLIVRIEFICKSHALCNLSHGRMNIWGDSVHGQISFPYTQKTPALEQKTQKTTALEQKTVFRSRAGVFWVYGKLIWPWYEESNTWFLQAILSLGPDSEKVRLVLKVGFCATKVFCHLLFVSPLTALTTYLPTVITDKSDNYV